MPSQVLNISEDADSINSPGNSCSLHLLWPNCVSVCAHCLFFSQLSPVRIVCLHLLCCPPPVIFKNPLSPLLQVEQGPHSSCLTGSSPLITFLDLFWTCSSISVSFLCWGAQDLTRYSRCGPPVSHREERSPPLTSSVVVRSLNIDLLKLKTVFILDFKNKYLFQPDSK